jgi:hypothetical protein
MLRKKRLKRSVYKLLSSLLDKPLSPPTVREEKLVEELKATFLEFPNAENKDYPPSRREWHENVERLRELVLNDDPREFLRWDVIQNTMSVTHASYVSQELKYLKGLPDWETRWSKAIKESIVGHPVPHWSYPESSGNLIHHAYHWAKFEESSCMRVGDLDLVFEFGGGYGSMCRLIYSLGFDGGYVIFDLPAFSALQQFFLECTGAKVLTPAELKTVQSGITCVSELDELKDILTADSDANKSMFIATWSISETPIELRQLVLPLLHSYKAFLIAYQSQFREINNVDFFKNWSLAQSGIEWYDWKIEHIPKHNRYLVGRRKTS